MKIWFIVTAIILFQSENVFSASTGSSLHDEITKVPYICLSREPGPKGVIYHIFPDIDFTTYYTLDDYKIFKENLRNLRALGVSLDYSYIHRLATAIDEEIITPQVFLRTDNEIMEMDFSARTNTLLYKDLKKADFLLKGETYKTDELKDWISAIRSMPEKLQVITALNYYLNVDLTNGTGGPDLIHIFRTPYPQCENYLQPSRIFSDLYTIRFEQIKDLSKIEKWIAAKRAAGWVKPSPSLMDTSLADRRASDSHSHASTLTAEAIEEASDEGFHSPTHAGAGGDDDRETNGLLNYSPEGLRHRK